MQIVDVTGPPGYPLPQIAEAGKATVADMNANGGISGHPISLKECDSQVTPNGAQACARQAVSSGVVAVIGDLSYNPSSILPILTAAKIPYIPGLPFDPTELSSPVSFPFATGLAPTAAIGVLAAQHCSSSVIVTPDTAAAPEFVTLINAALKIGGKPAASVVKFAVTVGDFSVQAAQVFASKAQCVISLLDPAQALAFYPALQATGSTQKTVGVSGQTVSAALIKAVPKMMEGALVADTLPSYAGPKLAAYRALTAKYSDPKKYDFAYTGAELAYVAFLIFKQVAEKVLAAKQDVTAATILSVLNSSTAVNTGGLVPTVDFTKPAPIKGFTRQFGRSATFDTVTNGQIVTLDNNQFHDMTAVFQSAFGTA